LFVGVCGGQQPAVQAAVVGAVLSRLEVAGSAAGVTGQASGQDNPLQQCVRSD
jgi:hypothetical protein